MAFRAANDNLIMASSALKTTIVDDWANQRSNYEIVSLGRPDDFDRAGHIPNAIHINWVDILALESLARLGSGKSWYCTVTTVMPVCCPAPFSISSGTSPAASDSG